MLILSFIIYIKCKDYVEFYIVDLHKCSTKGNNHARLCLMVMIKLHSNILN